MESTIISVKKIWLAAASLQEDQELSLEAWPFEGELQFKFLEPLVFSFQITKLKDALNIFVDPWALLIEESCSLCGKSIELELEGGESEYLYRAKRDPNVDEEFYLFALKNFALDLQPVIEQECLLAKPLFPCCEACTAHKNAEEVMHIRVDEEGIHKTYEKEQEEEPVQEKPFALLKELLKKDNKNS